VSIEERINKIICLQLSPAVLSDPQTSDELADLGADSLDTVEIMMAIEDEFDISVDQDDFEALKTVGEVYEFVKRHIGEGS